MSFRKIFTLILSFLLLNANAEVMHTERFSEHNSGLPSMATGVAKGDDGFVWVSTLDGICRYDGYQFKTYRANPSDYNTSISNQFTKILCLDNTTFALLNNNGQAFLFSAKDKSFRLYPSPERINASDFFYVTDISLDADKNLYLVSPNKILKIPYGQVDEEDAVNPKLLNINSFYAADTVGVSWNIEGGALIKKVEGNPSFIRKNITTVDSYSTFNDVVCTATDSEGNIWIALQSSEVAIMSPNDNVRFLSETGTTEAFHTQFDKINTIEISRHGGVWLGGDNGVYRVTKDGDRYKTTKYEKKNCIVTDILEDSRKNIWVATERKGLMLLVESARDSFITMENEWKYSYPPTLFKINCLFEDYQGVVWLGSPDGITLLDNQFNKPSDIKFFFYNSETTNLQYSYITDIKEDDEHKIWISTFGGGIYYCGSDRMLGVPLELQKLDLIKEPLDSEIVLALFPTKNSRICVLTQKSFVVINSKNDKTQYFNFGNGAVLRSNSIKRHTKDMVTIASNSGFYIVNTSELNQIEYDPSIILSEFRFLKSSEDADENMDDINTVSNVELKHDNKDFSIRFASTDYRSGTQVRYAYRLYPFSDKWTYTNEPVASYTNIPYGDYKLTIRCTNSDGNWSRNERTLNITVLPSNWETPWAYLLYFLMLCAVVAGIMFAYSRYYRLRTKIALDAELSEEKMRFFTDISHEIRTPLTLISAPIEKLSSSPTLTDDEQKLVGVMRKNTQRMTKMIDQLLDFSKFSSHHIELNLNKFKISDIFESLSKIFQTKSQEKNITLSFANNVGDAPVVADYDKMETVMINLVSNAMKFTPVDGNIIVGAASDGSNLVLTVTDNGCGIDKKELSSIFNRFMTNSHNMELGKGIGLSIVKEIVDKHGGKITVDSEKGKGSKFTVTIPMSNASYVEKDVYDETSTQTVSTHSHSSYTILINEDNAELRRFIVDTLSADYTVIEAEDGRIGVEKTKEFLPDLVITDIMMPHMDGYEATRQIRKLPNPEIANIPIVAMTANAFEEDKQCAFAAGMNGHVAKPIEISKLKAALKEIFGDED
ncbi:MAG: ATP-binding protein [Bacteroidales bacterium]|nr:ATP-binding protein [Bacteroidales bacterium]